MSVAPSSTKVQDILNVPSQWPASFPRPVVGTRVLTYVFDQKDDVELLLKYIKDKYPKALVSVVKDKAGFSSVTITQIIPSGQSAVADDCDNCPYGTGCYGTDYCTGA